MVITGFLGAGKTTLINKLLANAALEDTAVIVNEFGQIAIDHLLVEKSSDDIYEIAGGCLCCTVRAELAETLADLVDRLQTGKINNLARIIIETTGMADPVPVLHAIQGHPALAMALAIDRVITVVDAIAGLETLERFEEARRQLAVADIVLISKSRLAGQLQHETTLSGLQQQTAAQIIPETEIEPNIIRLFETNIEPGKQLPNNTGHNHHTTAITTHIVSHDGPLAWHVIEDFLDLIRSRTDHEILRIKGIIETLEDPSHPVVVNGVQRMLYPPRQLDGWREDQCRGTRLVIIGTGLDGTEIDRTFKALTGSPQLDTPDRAAISDNPLAIPGT